MPYKTWIPLDKKLQLWRINTEIAANATPMQEYSLMTSRNWNRESPSRRPGHAFTGRSVCRASESTARWHRTLVPATRLRRFSIELLTATLLLNSFAFGSAAAMTFDSQHYYYELTRSWCEQTICCGIQCYFDYGPMDFGEGVPFDWVIDLPDLHLEASYSPSEVHLSSDVQTSWYNEHATASISFRFTLPVPSRFDLNGSMTKANGSSYLYVCELDGSSCDASGFRYNLGNTTSSDIIAEALILEPGSYSIGVGARDGIASSEVTMTVTESSPPVPGMGPWWGVVLSLALAWTALRNRS